MTREKSPPESVKHAVILCHPDIDSFNAAVAERYCATVQAQGQTPVLRDLYRIGFDPVLRSEEKPGPDQDHLSTDVARELEFIADARMIVLIYPIWFGMPPAMLKGYIDRVLGAGVTYGAIKDRTPHAFLTGKRMLSFTSSATTTQWLEEQGALGSLRNVVDDYLRHAFSLSDTRHVHFSAIVPGLQPRFVEEALLQVEQIVQAECGALRTHA